MISYMITLHKLFSHMIKCRSEFAFFRMPNMIHKGVRLYLKIKL